MLIPLLIFGGMIAAHVTSKRPAATRVNVGKVSLPYRPTRPALNRLLLFIKRGEEVQPWMIDDAFAEAYDLGDWRTLAKLQSKFGQAEAIDEREEEQPSEEPSEESKREDSEPDQGGAEIVIGKASPFQGIPDEAWHRFVAGLETERPDYQGPKHVGRFHHSRERLAHLKIEDVSTPEKQYEALVSDLADARESAADLIREFEFQAISIDGAEHVITLSGMLAVLKAAGIDRARRWFTHPDDRKSFPKTTEMFAKANGTF